MLGISNRLINYVNLHYLAKCIVMNFIFYVYYKRVYIASMCFLSSSSARSLQATIALP